MVATRFKHASGSRSARSQDQEHADRHDEPALDLVAVGELADVGRLGIGAGDLGRHVHALVFAEIIV